MRPMDIRPNFCIVTENTVIPIALVTRLSAALIEEKPLKNRTARIDLTEGRPSTANFDVG